MAVASNHLAALCLALAPCLTLASPESERLQIFAAERLSNAQAEAEVRYLHCTAPGAPVLPVDTFKGLELSDEEKKLALLYFNARARRACTEQTDTALLVASQLAREAGLPEYARADDPHAERVAATLAELYSEQEYKARYWAVPEPKREKLERIDALQQRFDLIESARAVGLPLP
ncbi:hypothetical protein [Pseudomonas indica]|uniref:hypothetical protein n=1 Tax=Pseudomonas indica TaxID=137658 RepID=UPI0023F624CB|nr:hypothetical protein [Pseudomonas indica]MBU3055416.1 hypothetical protein [Pseudomonas indica]